MSDTETLFVVGSENRTGVSTSLRCLSPKPGSMSEIGIFRQLTHSPGRRRKFIFRISLAAEVQLRRLHSKFLSDRNDSITMSAPGPES